MASIDGLGSGLDTTTIVSQLMATERLPQQRLQTARQAAVTAGDTWGKIRTAMVFLQSVTKPLADPVHLSQKFTATSSDTAAIGVTVGSGAVASTTTLKVGALAKPFQMTSAAVAPTGVGTGRIVADHGLVAVGLGSVTAASVTAATGHYTLTVASDGTVSAKAADGTVVPDLSTLGLNPNTFTPVAGTATITVVQSTGNAMTAEQLAAAINNTRGTISALVVTDSSDAKRLVVTGTKTGETSRMNTSGLTGLGTPTYRDAVKHGTNAAVEIVGTGITVNPTTNTVSDLIPGVTLDLLAADASKQVTVTVKSDEAGNTATVKGIVDALNGVLKEINTGSRWNATTKTAAPLTGNAGARILSRQIMDAVSGAGSAVQGMSLGAIGIRIEQSGTYSFDEAALKKTLESNPNGVADLVKKLTVEVADVAKSSLGSGGQITSGRELADSRARSLQQRVDEWDVRLAAIQKRLTTQFTNLDTALGSLRSQGNWLAGQLASLQK